MQVTTEQDEPPIVVITNAPVVALVLKSEHTTSATLQTLTALLPAVAALYARNPHQPVAEATISPGPVYVAPEGMLVL